MKVLVITECNQCPNRDEDGWCCDVDKYVDVDIPDDCPLPDAEDEG